MGDFLKSRYIPSFVVDSFGFRFPCQKRSKVNCFRFWPLRNNARRLLFPSFLLALIIKIQYGGQQIVFSVRTFPPPQQDLFKKTFSSITFLNCPWVFYMFFRKDRHCKFYLLSPSSLDLINIISSTYLGPWSNESSGETWQRSRRSSPAAGSYIQPCRWKGKYAESWILKETCE